MPALQHKKSLGPPLLGLNDILDIKVIDDNEASECINARLNFHGILEKFPGYVKDGSPFPNVADSFIRTMFNFKRGTSVDWLLVAAQDDNNANSTYKVDFKYTVGDGNYNYFGLTTGSATFATSSTSVIGSGTAWSTQLKAGDKIKVTSDPDSDYTEIQSVNSNTSLTLVAGYPGSNATTQPYIARIILNKNATPFGLVFDDKAIIADGLDTLYSFDSTTTNLIPAFNSAFGEPSPKFLEFHKNRLFGANTLAGPSDIFWSASFDETSWDAAATTPVYPQDNGSIVAIKSFADSLIVVKDNGKLYQVIGNFATDPGTFDYIRRIDYPDKTIGTIAGRSVVVHKGNLFFLAEGGLFVLDQRMVISRFNRNAESFISGLNFGSNGAPVAKSFPYQTNAQWNAGTHDGTEATTGGILQPFFDSLTITGVGSDSYAFSSAIDANNVGHIAYFDGGAVLRHLIYNVDGTTTTEAIPVTTAPTWLSMAIASNGTIGVAYGTASSKVAYIEKTGSWGAEQIVESGGSVGNFPVKLVFASDNQPRILYQIGLTTVFHYATKASGSFIIHSATVSGTIGSSAYDMALDSSDNVGISYVRMPGSGNWHATAYKSTNDGGSFTLVEDYDTGQAVANVDSSLIGFNTAFTSTGDLISGYGTYTFSGPNVFGGPIHARDHTATTTTLIDNGSQDFLLGFKVGYSDGYFAYWGASNNVASLRELYAYETSTVIGNNSGTIRANSTIHRSNFTSNGKVFFSVARGASSGQLVVRRLAFHGIWTSQQLSDSALTSWGIYGAVFATSGNTVNFYVALASSGSATSFNLITPGSLISSNNTLTHAATKVEFLLTSLSQPTVSSVVLNYFGAASGNDPKEPVGISHNAELFVACANTSSTANDRMLSLDIGEALLKPTYSVNALERYKKKLYAGSSTNGDVYILLQGLDYNGSSYSMDVQTKEFFLDSVDVRKDGYKIYVLYNVKPSGTLTFSYRLDNSMVSGGSAWIPTTIDLTGASGLPGIAEINIGGQPFKSIQMRYQNSEAGTAVEVISTILVYGYLYQR